MKKYPNIISRLMAGLICIIVTISVLVTLCLNDFKKINQINQNIIKHPFTVSNAAKNIGIYIAAMHRSMKDVPLANNDLELESAIKKVADYEKEVYENFEILRERFLGNLNDVEVAYITFYDWKPIRDEVIELTRQGKTFEAAEITKGKGAAHVELLFRKIQVMIDYAHMKAQEFNANSTRIVNNTYDRILIFTIAGLFLIALISVWLFRSINVPLLEIIKKIREISDNGSALNIKYSKNILSMLNQSVGELEKFQTKLKELVEERTRELQKEKNFTEYALNNQIDTFLVFDSETGKPIRWNKAFEEISGYSHEEIAQLKAPDAFYSKTDLKIAAKTIQEVYDNGFGVAQIKLITKEGKRIPFEYYVTLLNSEDANKTYFVSIGRNITERLKNEAEIQKYQTNLEKLVDERTGELQQLNEEYLTTNEELATANEELASTNKELEISNEKLAVSNENLNKANAELERFNNLFVGRELRIKQLKKRVAELERLLNIQE